MSNFFTDTKKHYNKYYYVIKKYIIITLNVWDPLNTSLTHLHIIRYTIRTHETHASVNKLMQVPKPIR